MPATQFQGVSPTGADIAAQMDANGGQIIKPFASGSKDWRYAAAAGGIVNTAAVAIKAAAGAGVRNALTAIQISNAHASAATEVTVSDGATVIWRNHLAAGTRMSVDFPTPLLGTANTALNVACVTTGAAVYINAQGYTTT